MLNKTAISVRADVLWSIAIPNTIAGLKQGLSELIAWLQSHGIGQEAEDRACLVFEEIVTNVMRYGFPDASSRIIAAAAEIGDDLIMSFDDDGVAFDPSAAPVAAPARSLDEANIGGLGLTLIRNAAKTMEYERTRDGHNHFTVTLAR